MFTWRSIQFALLPALVLVVGCMPQSNREATEVITASDIEIKFEDVEVPEKSAEPAPAGTQSSPSTSTPAPSTASATEPKKEMAATPAETNASPAAASKTPSAASNYTGPAKFTGRVVIKGAAPKLSVLLAQGAVTKDPFCSETQVDDESAVVSADGGLANVFVYMKKAPRSGVPEYSGEGFDVDQKGCVFVPHAQVIRVGQPFLLKNSDPVAHNVRFNGLQSQFNETVGAGSADGLAKTIEFAERLPVQMVCDFHNWMTSYVLPVDHPWATVTDENGNFEITDLPDGDWDFVLWHEKALYVDRGFSVKAAANTHVEQVFEVDASKLSK